MDYTPTTNEVRKRYSRGYLTEHVQEFDRWLAGVKAQERQLERERIIALLDAAENHIDADREWYAGLAHAIALIKGENK